MRIRRSAILQFAVLLSLACDNSVKTVDETPAPNADALPASAVPPTASAYVAVGRVDLQAVVDGVAEGSIKSAAELETKLSSEAVADVDLDADGKRDELRIVERRAEKETVFEIRALPSAKVDAAAKAEGSVKVEAEAKADAQLEIAAAPVVAELRFEAQADLGKAVAKASFSESFVASAKLDSNVTVEHTFTGVSVTAEGTMQVEAEANAFLAWTFRPRRPLFVAEVFVVVQASEREPDPCWPPGHCKHGLWKATGELPPGQERKHDDDHDKGDRDDHGKDKDKDKPEKAKGDRGEHDDDKGKPDKPDKDDKGAAKGKPGKSEPAKGGGAKGEPAKGGGKGKGK